MRSSLFALFLLVATYSPAQLILNEISQGASGSKEYVEFVVVGNATCSTPVPCIDLRGVVFDDNNDDHCKAFYQILDVFNKEGKLKNIDKEFKSRLFEDFLKNTQGVKGLGQFFTPRTVMAGMVEMADVRNTLKDGANVNDPACGVGGFLLETIANRVGDFYFKKNDQY